MNSSPIPTASAASAWRPITANTVLPVAGEQPCREDQRREQGMAYRLQQLARQHQRILFVCGMAHLERIKGLYSAPQAAPLERVRRDGVTVFNLHPDSCREILAEFPFLSAVYELRRGPLPDEPLESGAGLRKRFHALELITGGKEELSEEQLLENAIRRTARHLGHEGAFLDRQRLIYRLFSEAARHYRQETGETLHIWQKRAFFRFARNYALQAGHAAAGPLPAPGGGARLYRRQLCLCLLPSGHLLSLAD